MSSFFLFDILFFINYAVGNLNEKGDVMKLMKKPKTYDFVTALYRKHRKARGKKTEWMDVIQIKQLCKSDNDMLAEVLYIANVSLYIANVPLAGRKAVLSNIRDIAEVQEDK